MLFSLSQKRYFLPSQMKLDEFREFKLSIDFKIRWVETLKSIDHSFQSKMTKNEISQSAQKFKKFHPFFENVKFCPKIFLKTKFNLEDLICDGSLSLIGYAAVNAFGYAWRKYQNINILRVAEYPVREKILKSQKFVTRQQNVTRLSKSLLKNFLEKFQTIFDEKTQALLRSRFSIKIDRFGIENDRFESKIGVLWSDIDVSGTFFDEMVKFRPKTVIFSSKSPIS